MPDGKVAAMSRFNAYSYDVLARLIKVCAQHLLPVAQGIKFVRWAEKKVEMLEDAWREHLTIQEAAEALYSLAVESV